MIFQIYSGGTGWQLLGWVMVFGGLILVNEIARRTKAGGMACFFALPAVLTVYFISIYVGAARGAEWALNNQTYVHMNSWFHYAKLYAALAGCIGFMVLKYHWGKLGKSHGFKVFPFVIVAINILIAVVSDFESVVRAGSIAGGWWKSSEGVWLYGGWWNILNGIAGILNILCMTGWWGIYSSKDKKDMLWPDMTWCFILAYDIWNFQYTYLNLPTHSWYCGFALLLAPTVANALWNKGGWIQNRANTLALWCMFAQVFPLFQDASRFTTVSSVYGAGGAAAAFGEAMPTTANPAAQGIISVISIVVNLAVFLVILKRAKQQNKNPYTNEIFTDQKDFKLAMDRAE
ncbi:DUF5692 family protein [Parablautia intestinalis]|uniref:DUF5692 family protein n=1 Tax=Parablautia intestinalis TaxID=2320100 RepID=UPI00256EE8BE|nr:DUF5692 family protein [Parablautia intestinalis]